MTEDLFEIYVEKVVVPGFLSLKAHHNVNDKGLMIMDGCPSHCGQKAIKMMEDNGILVQFLPPGSSHLNQACDRLIFQQFRRIFKTTTISIPLSRASKHYLEDAML